jgi:O-antigen ligase
MTGLPKRNLRYTQRLVAIALASFYIFALVLDRAAGVIFAILILSGLVVIARHASASGSAFLQLTKAYWPLNLAMATPLIAVLANQISTGHFAGRSVDLPFRLALFMLVSWTVTLVPYKHLKQLQWPFVIGAIFSVIKMVVLTKGGTLRYATDFIPIGIFAELCMLLGAFSIFSIPWNSSGNKLAIFLKLLAAGATVYAAYLSQSRGTWLTIPFFGLIAYIVAKDLRRKHKVLVAIICIAALGLFFSYGKIAAERLMVAQEEIQQYEQGADLDSSLGIRFQLWKGSWVLFKEHPAFGVGVENYRSALLELSARKIISPAAAVYQHSHNDVLFMMAKLGVFGLLAMLAIYFVPMFYFARELRDDDKEIRAAASMGLALCAGIAGLGLSDVVFLWWEVFPFYAISIALFLVCIIKRKECIALDRAEVP